VHTTTNHIVTVDGDTAHQRCTLLLIKLGRDGAQSFDRVGWYDDELVRTAAGWRFRSRTVSFP
jgi:hypothetical protein